MNWITILMVVAVVGRVFMLKRSGQFSTKTAAADLKNGAVVTEGRVNICNHLEFQANENWHKNRAQPLAGTRGAVQ